MKEDVPNLLGQHFVGHVDAQGVVVPQDLLHVIHALQRRLQRRHVPLVHALHDDHGESPGPEVLYQYVLTVDRLQRVGQITQYVVVHSGPDKAQHRGHQQRHRQQYHQHTVSGNDPSDEFQGKTSNGWRIDDGELGDDLSATACGRASSPERGAKRKVTPGGAASRHKRYNTDHSVKSNKSEGFAPPFSILNSQFNIIPSPPAARCCPS